MYNLLQSSNGITWFLEKLQSWNGFDDPRITFSTSVTKESNRWQRGRYKVMTLSYQM